MSLNDLSLNPHLLTQLYPSSLLETEPKPAALKDENAVLKEPVQQQQQAPALPEYSIINEPNSKEMAAKQEHISPTITATQPQGLVAEQPVTYGNTPSLGGNKKGVLILVNQEAAPFLPDSELEFLSAVLSACQLSIADVAIVNLHHYPQPYTALLQQFSAKQVLLIGVTPQEVDLPFHFPHFQLQPFDGRTYLSAFPLRQMAQDRSLKMQLWGCLKKMFGV